MSTRVTKNAVAFSTLGCPEWSPATIVRKAAEYGYDQIEWRGGSDGHLTPNMTATRRAELRQRMEDAGVSALAVTAYTSFVSDDPADRRANVDELRRYLDLAADLGSDFVRIFLGELQAGVELADVTDRIVESVGAGLTHARTTGVNLALEPHDDFVRPQAVTPILDRLPDSRLTVVWDIGNTYAAGETTAGSFQLLGKRLGYVQVKDCIGQFPHRQLTLVGDGAVPLAEAFDLLANASYAGPISYEWERAWYPELPPAEVAFPAARQAIGSLLANTLPTGAPERNFDQA